MATTTVQQAARFYAENQQQVGFSRTKVHFLLHIGSGGLKYDLTPLHSPNTLSTAGARAYRSSNSLWS